MRTTLKSRVERLEKAERFRRWFHFVRFVEGLTNEQLETFASQGRWPEPLPEPLPMGASRLDRLDRKSLIRLWEKDEREFGNRSQGELDFYCAHGHWPTQACNEHCQKLRVAGTV